jgi:hypothetical protein
MAILKKRTSSKKIPEARGLDRGPLDSVIRSLSDRPSLTGRTSGSITSGSSRPNLGTNTTSGGVTLPPVTSTITKPTNKPKLTTSTSAIPKTTLVPKTTLAPKKPVIPKIPIPKVQPPPNRPTNPTIPRLNPSARPNVSNPNSTGNRITNALTGAALGVGSKLIYDLFSGKNSDKKDSRKPSEDEKKPSSESPKKPAGGSSTRPSVTDPSKGTLADPSLGLPKGAIDNGDGTYTVGDKTYSMENDALLYTTDADGKLIINNQVPADKTLSEGEKIVAEEKDLLDTTVADNTTPEYYQDAKGNVYTMNEDGSYELYSDAGGSDDTTVADNTYTDPDTGAEWTMADNGEWSTDFNYDDYSGYDDYSYADYSDDGGEYYADYGDDGGEYYGKRGGLIAMMKKGGIPHFLDGGSSDVEDDTNYRNDNYGGDDFTPTLGRQYFDDGSYIDTFDDGSTIAYDSDGNIYNTTESYQTTRDDKGNYVVTDGYGNRNVYDQNGNFIPNPISNVGSGPRGPTYSPYSPPPSTLSPDYLSSLFGALGNTAGAAGAGALIYSLLDSDFTGGGSGLQNQGLDMSQVGIIDPRTTDFGIGPTNFVGYDQYGTDSEEYIPNEELLRNLNALGFNPVNEGDYGYEEGLVEEPVDETPAMASGGLSSMATPVSSYYTFGQPADILANLGMRPQPPMNSPEMMAQVGQQQPAQQAQQQGLPQQAPPQMAQQTPQGMPQQGMMPQQLGMPSPMRKGGLPDFSNVPMTMGRMDFRRGSAVHGEGDGQSDDIPAMLADGEYVIDAETVAQIGNGSTKAGAQALDKFRESIRTHKRSAPVNKIPPKTKALTSYLKGAK